MTGASSNHIWLSNYMKSHQQSVTWDFLTPLPSARAVLQSGARHLNKIELRAFIEEITFQLSTLCQTRRVLKFIPYVFIDSEWISAITVEQWYWKSKNPQSKAFTGCLLWTQCPSIRTYSAENSACYQLNPIFMVISQRLAPLNNSMRNRLVRRACDAECVSSRLKSSRETSSHFVCITSWENQPERLRKKRAAASDKLKANHLSTLSRVSLKLIVAYKSRD